MEEQKDLAPVSIDYGRYPMENGQLPNRNPKTGIRYGIIHSNKLAGWAIGEFEPVYPDDWNGEEEPVDPIDWIYNQEGYELRLDEQGDVWVFMSPYTTMGAHCSPCAPGAITIDSPVEDARAYCLGADWFEDDKAPYEMRKEASPR